MRPRQSMAELAAPDRGLFVLVPDNLTLLGASAGIAARADYTLLSFHPPLRNSTALMAAIAE